jgi:hypothetical protein
MADQTKRQQLETHLAARALQDPDFRARLLLYPKAAIEREIGLRFPDGVRISVHEEKLNQLHIVLPIDLFTAENPLAAAAGGDGAAPDRPFWLKT